jgi:hypothetical protein
MIDWICQTHQLSNYGLVTIQCWFCLEFLCSCTRHIYIFDAFRNIKLMSMCCVPYADSNWEWCTYHSLLADKELSRACTGPQRNRSQIMATNSTIPQDAIRNPYTTLAFMPPDVADQFQVKCYLNIAVLAVRSMHFWAINDLTLYTHRLTLGTGSWQFQRSTK